MNERTNAGTNPLYIEPSDSKNSSYRYSPTCVYKVFISALFIKPKDYNSLNISKDYGLLHKHKMEYYAVIKKNEEVHCLDRE